MKKYIYRCRYQMFRIFRDKHKMNMRQFIEYINDVFRLSVEITDVQFSD